MREVQTNESDGQQTVSLSGGGGFCSRGAHQYAHTHTHIVRRTHDSCMILNLKKLRADSNPFNNLVTQKFSCEAPVNILFLCLLPL